MKIFLVIAIIFISINSNAKTRIVTLDDNLSGLESISAVVFGDTIRFVNNQSKPINLEFILAHEITLFSSGTLNPGAYFEHVFSDLNPFQNIDWYETKSQTYLGIIVAAKQPIRISPKDTLLIKNKTNFITVFYSQVEAVQGCAPCEVLKDHIAFESNIVLIFDNQTLYDGDVEKLVKSPLVSENGRVQNLKYFVITIPPNTLTEGEHLFQVKSNEDPGNLFDQAHFTVIK